MAVFVPSLSTRASRMKTGERRVAGRVDAKGLTKRVHMRNFHKRSRQQLHKRQRSKQFSFKSVGMQAQGRTTVLKINYRNTRQILQTASRIADGLLTAENSEQGEDGIPLLLPVSCCREGPEPMVINLPTLHEEAAKVAELLSAAHQEGHAWGDMAVLCLHYDGMEECARALTRRRLPHQLRKGSGDFRPLEDSIKVMTIHVSKGLEFPIVFILSDARTPANQSVESARLYYVAATRATEKLFYFGAPCVSPLTRKEQHAIKQ